MKAYEFFSAAIALVVVGAATLVPLVGVLLLGPVAAFVVGTIAAYLTWRDEVIPINRGIRTGLFAGIGALVGMGIVITMLDLVIISDPWMIDFVRWTGSFSGVATAVIRFLAGLVFSVWGLILGINGGMLGSALRTLQTRGSLFPSSSLH